MKTDAELRDQFAKDLWEGIRAIIPVDGEIVGKLVQSATRDGWNAARANPSPREEILRAALIEAGKVMRSHLRGDMMAKITHADLGSIEEALAKFDKEIGK